MEMKKTTYKSQFSPLSRDQGNKTLVVRVGGKSFTEPSRQPGLLIFKTDIVIGFMCSCIVVWVLHLCFTFIFLFN